MTYLLVLDVKDTSQVCLIPNSEIYTFENKLTKKIKMLTKSIYLIKKRETERKTFAETKRQVEYSQNKEDK
jgi:hypothetical protein